MKIKLLFTIIPIIIFYSCASTRYLTIDIREPAYVSFPAEVTKVVIVDNSSPDLQGNKDDSRTGILPVDSAREILVESLTLFMNEENYFSEVELYPYKTNRNREVTPLTKRKIEHICKEKGANALISLDLFAIAAEIEAGDNAYFSYYSVLQTKLGTIFRVFSPQGEEYSTAFAYVDSLFRTDERDWSRLKSNSSAINELLVETVVTGADKLTSYFIPSWKKQERWFYTDNSSQMKAAQTSLESGDWTNAAKIWGDLHGKESNVNKKVKLASNLALANEYLDDIGNAVAWINTAFDLLTGKNMSSELPLQILSYKNILENRQKNRPKLLEQLGLEEVFEVEE
ncbi:DUF6340 family protein [Dysgonomonas sp. 511]|uniref:DUF6340 family protein n=1 Tax=Dysgonomonas sp. 511 TaxID=2302930 RepID=UPI0013D563F3|nr:DUF6340 family protein [Dysgonomonas sp. 511]NDV77499.1 hypothetical protein [Dysgonomonas sp. 511]